MRRFTLLSFSLFAAACGGCGGSDDGATTGGDAATGGDAIVDDSSSGADGTASDSSSPSDTSTMGDTKLPPGSSPTIGPCRIYPADNPWNQDISGLPVHPDAAKFAGTMHTGTALHPDWGTFSEGYGIPYNVGTGAAPQKMTWSEKWGPTDSDKLPCSDGYQWCYPIPSSCKIEGPSDSHLLYLDTAGAPDNCTLYELWETKPFSSGWTAGNGAIFHLGSNALRMDGLTSADAAGLPILPGLVRWEEVAAGEIKHALRFTMNNSYNGYIHPATHAAGLSDSAQPPMGLRLRLKSSVDISSYSKEAKVILTAMKKYGIILADNGSDWYITGEENDHWQDPEGADTTVMDNLIHAFNNVKGGDFEPVNTGATSTAGL